MEKLAIMDYINHEVHLFDVDTDRRVELSELGFRDSDCYYMFGEDIKIVEHEEIIK